MTHIGKPVRALDWEAQTSGAFAYTADIHLDGLLHAAVLRSPYAFARILAVDTADAEGMPGVRAVITAADFPPGVRYLHEGAADRPPLADGTVRFVGQEVAAVAADTPEQAQDAAAAIRVRYARRTAPLDLDAALSPGAAMLHDRPHGLPNRAARFLRRWGDFSVGRAASKWRVSGRFHFAAQHHACMEPSIVVARWLADSERLELWSPTGAPYYVVQEVAHVLGLAPGQVACREIGTGGSFGARTKVSDYEALAAQLSRKAGAPVRLALSRAEDFATTKSRHAFRIAMALDGDADGRLCAIEAHLEADNGAYSHSGASVAGAALKGLGMLYQPDGATLSAELVDTAKRPGGQFRGYGTTQSSFALECLMDELAERSGIDPLAYRIANANPAGTTTLLGARLHSSGMAECLEACGAAIGWRGRGAGRTEGIGTGFASGVHVSGSYVGGTTNRSACAIDVHWNGRVHVRFGSGDAGTGQKTILAQLVASVLDVPLTDLSVEMIDSDRTPFDMGSWSSRGTHYGGHAALLAAETVKAKLIEAALPETGADSRLEGGMVVGRGGRMTVGDVVARLSNATDGVISVEEAYVETRVEAPDPVTGIGNISASYNFAGHAAKVAVCRRTGKVRLIDYVAAHDVGTAINPMMVEGQIVGGVVMGVGAALGEEVVTQAGRVANPAFVNYAMPRAADMPPVRALLVATDDPAGPMGAKAVGEIGINPPPAAIANAIYDAVGVRLRATPFTPDKLMAALNGAGWARRFPVRLWRRPGRWWIALVRRAYRAGLFDLLHRRMLARSVSPLPVRTTALVRAGTFGDALRRAGEGCVPVAGGIDLHHRRKQGLVAAGHLVSLKALPELAHCVQEADGSWRIGAAATLTEVAGLCGIGALNEAIMTIASPQVRNMATMGGNLLQANRCWFLRNGFDCFKRRGGLAPCYAITGDHRFHHAVIGGHRCQSVTPSDLATVLAALDATLSIAGPAGERQIAVADFYTGPGETRLGTGEILREVHVPSQGRARTAFEKLALWEGDFAIASAAIVLGETGARVVLGGMAPTPLVLADLGADAPILDGAGIAPRVEAALARIAHPLPHNLWKLDAVTGLVANAFDRMAAAR